MTSKIKGRSLLPLSLQAVLFILLMYTRFYNLPWGLPYPFHPDERNIANAVQNLTCHLPGSGFFSCLDPKFFAYGQLSVYLAYALALFSRLFTHVRGPIGFTEAVISLRVISAFASVVTVLFALKIVRLFSKSDLLYYASYLLLIFSPAAIQFSHYGTTESLLMLFYTILVYVSVRFVKGEIPLGVYAGAGGLVVGLAAGAKISSLVFTLLPFMLFVFPKHLKEKKHNRFVTYLLEVKYRIVSLFFFGVTLLFTTLATSFYSFIAGKEALGSLRYESDVALGRLDVFYTRTFSHTTPVLFHFTHVFPYALGLIATVLFVTGFFLLQWKKEHNVLRLAFLLYFLPTAFTYTKWTRFMAPVFPLMIIIVALTVFRIYEMLVSLINGNRTMDVRVRSTSLLGNKIVFSFLMLVLFVPGAAYLSVYRTEDVRFKASDWIYTHVKPDAYILEETANVIDIPVLSPDQTVIPRTNYKYVSFNFYEADSDPMTKRQLQMHVDNADYIFVPSRRIFANHTCAWKSAEVCRLLRKKYPVLNNYYDGLFSGSLGFREAAIFTSYPRIQFFGHTIVEFPDEQAEETWTVFDHPVIRIYKRG